MRTCRTVPHGAEPQRTRLPHFDALNVLVNEENQMEKFLETAKLQEFTEEFVYEGWTVASLRRVMKKGGAKWEKATDRMGLGMGHVDRLEAALQ